MSRKSTLREYFESLLLSVVVVVFVRAFLAEAVQIPTGSMEDTLLPGDHLFINKFVFRNYDHSSLDLLPFSEIRRRDVVVFKFFDEPGRANYYVKRVIALPGETVEIRAKQVYVDGRALDEPYAVFKEPWRSDLRPRDFLEPVKIPLGHYFVLGDNRDRSYDSRFWGPLGRDRIVGRPLFVWWSFGGDDSAGTPPGGKGNLLTRLFHQTRWRRTGMLVD